MKSVDHGHSKSPFRFIEIMQISPADERRSFFVIKKLESTMSDKIHLGNNLTVVYKKYMTIL
mgnify:CR=1 FL=1